MPDATLNASYQTYKAHCSRRPEGVYAASGGCASMPDATLNASYQTYKARCSRRPDKVFTPHPAAAP
ncbi:TPA: hypothetical protein ACN6Y2_001371 [Escherichia albertii]|uniref:hypothetical protein n=1 Tax=Escherichia albertii TaxID=208962 RepID=UPI000743C363|nr:hypothetical protein [Escherichia albertii]HEB1166550.1 hypothetical protein [Escherichia albertii]HEB1503095.1 hypothetical protein [Escherichia albertii]